MLVIPNTFVWGIVGFARVVFAFFFSDWAIVLAFLKVFPEIASAVPSISIFLVYFLVFFQYSPNISSMFPKNFFGDSLACSPYSVFP